MNLNSVEYYYIRNSQGDITGLLDENDFSTAQGLFWDLKNALNRK